MGWRPGGVIICSILITSLSLCATNIVIIGRVREIIWRTTKYRLACHACQGLPNADPALYRRMLAWYLLLLFIHCSVQIYKHHVISGRPCPISKFRTETDIIYSFGIQIFSVDNKCELVSTGIYISEMSTVWSKSWMRPAKENGVNENGSYSCTLRTKHF